MKGAPRFLVRERQGEERAGLRADGEHRLERVVLIACGYTTGGWRCLGGLGCGVLVLPRRGGQGDSSLRGACVWGGAEAGKHGHAQAA